ncbi:MAG: exosortase C-terminal domain/associated protein EpsI [Nitrospiria bacterium]
MSAIGFRLLAVAVVLSAVLLLTGRVSSGTAGDAARLAEAVSAAGGPWRCVEAGDSDVEYADPAVDEAFAQVCRHPDGTSVTVYVGYARAQTDRKRIRSPRANYPDNTDPRWSYTAGRRVEDASALHADQVMLRHAGGRRIAVVYWYQVGGRSFGDEYRYRLAVFGRHVRRGLTDAAIVRLASPVDADAADETFARQMDLARRLYPAVAHALRES